MIAACQAAVEEVSGHLWAAEFRKALRRALECAQFGNGYLHRTAPWARSTSDSDVRDALGNALFVVNTVKVLMAPFVPKSTAELHRRLGYESDLAHEPFSAAPLPAGRRVTHMPPLYSKLR